MNHKLRNSLSAFTATGAALAIALMVAMPLDTAPAGVLSQARQAADFVEGRAVGNTLSNAVALSAELATASALALDARQGMDAQNTNRVSRKGPHQRRQTAVMPYFSFSPRG
ncbi:hypothetical protein [Lysobacter fragariae]